METSEYADEAVAMLCELIATPSVSRDERAAADIMEHRIKGYGFDCHRRGNNVWAVAPDYDSARPTILLNAHIDTVKPVSSWTRDPFSPDIVDGRLYGLGSNDCGGGLCSLLQTFRWASTVRRSYNLVYLASAEEEVSGKNGISLVLPDASPYRCGDCRRTHGNAACHSRKRTDGPRHDSPRQVGACGPQRGC